MIFNISYMDMSFENNVIVFNKGFYAQTAENSASLLNNDFIGQNRLIFASSDMGVKS